MQILYYKLILWNWIRLNPILNIYNSYWPCINFSYSNVHWSTVIYWSLFLNINFLYKRCFTWRLLVVILLKNFVCCILWLFYKINNCNFITSYNSTNTTSKNTYSCKKARLWHSRKKILTLFLHYLNLNLKKWKYQI